MFLIGRQNRYLRRFLAKGTEAPGDAQTLPELGLRESRVFRRMVERAVFVEARPGQYYLDRAKAAAFKQQRRKQAFLVLTIVTAAALLALLVVVALR